MDYIDYYKHLSMDTYGIDPVDVKGIYNILTCYQSRYLMQKIFAAFDINLDEKNTAFPLNFFRFNLFLVGALAAFQVDKYSNIWVIAPFSMVKHDIYWNPLEIKIATTNQSVSLAYTNKVYKVNEDAVIFKCFDDYRGFADLIRNSGHQIANIDKAVKVAIMNNNVNFTAFVKNQKEATEIKKAYAKATEGEPFVPISKDLMPEDGSILTTFAQVFPASMLDKLLTARRTIVNNFLTEVGINNANIDKKERLNSMEVNSNDEETSANVLIVLNNLKQSFEKFNELSNYNMTVDLKYNYNDESYTISENNEEGGEVNG